MPEYLAWSRLFPHVALCKVLSGHQRPGESNFRVISLSFSEHNTRLRRVYDTGTVRSHKFKNMHYSPVLRARRRGCLQVCIMASTYVTRVWYLGRQNDRLLRTHRSELLCYIECTGHSAPLPHVVYPKPSLSIHEFHGIEYALIALYPPLSSLF